MKDNSQKKQLESIRNKRICIADTGDGIVSFYEIDFADMEHTDISTFWKIKEIGNENVTVVEFDLITGEKIPFSDKEYATEQVNVIFNMKFANKISIPPEE